MESKLGPHLALMRCVSESKCVREVLFYFILFISMSLLTSGQTILLFLPLYFKSLDNENVMCCLLAIPLYIIVAWKSVWITCDCQKVLNCTREMGREQCHLRGITGTGFNISHGITLLMHVLCDLIWHVMLGCQCTIGLPNLKRKIISQCQVHRKALYPLTSSQLRYSLTAGNTS